MKCFTLFSGHSVHLRGDKKIIPAEEMSRLLSAQEVLTLAEQEGEQHKIQVQREGEQLKQEAIESGFKEGLARWAQQLALLEEEMTQARSELEQAIIPLVMAAIRKIIGREIEVVPETIVDVIATSVKAVAQHRRITIYVRRVDLEMVEANRPRLKQLFEHLQSLTIAVRDDIAPGGCLIETERGILNVSLEGQLQAIESAFKSFLKERPLGAKRPAEKSTEQSSGQSSGKPAEKVTQPSPMRSTAKKATKERTKQPSTEKKRAKKG